MKRLVLLLICLVFVFGCAGCSDPETVIDLDPVADEFAGTSDSYGTVEVSAQKNALNPLTGRSDMASDRIGQRPYAVAVNNIYDSWPQYGLSQADVLIEMETEGGITRFMALYADTREVPLIGSVRSLRDQFLEAIYQLDPIIVHIGSSIYADKALAEHGFRTLDANVLPGALWIDKERLATGYATEHCKFTSGSLIDATLDDAKLKAESTSGLTAFNFLPEEEQIVPEGGQVSEVQFSISHNYDGDFRLDEQSGLYLKWQFGKPQTDAGNGDAQLAFENLLVLYGGFSNIEGTELIKVDFVSGGMGYYFSAGGYEEILWKKTDYANGFELTRANGEPLQLNAGRTYLAVVRDTNAAEMKITA